MAALRTVPSLGVERALWDAGAEVVVGVDEVGRGSWAGPSRWGRRCCPVTGGCTRSATPRCSPSPSASGCSPGSRGGARRGRWATPASRSATTWGCRPPRSWPPAGPSRAWAWRRRPTPSWSTASWDFVGGGHVTRIVRGDASCLSIATASVLAKVTRDRIMRAEAEHFPGYDFDLNKGYPCPRHKAALAAWGPTSIHRRAWVFMDHIPWPGVPRLVRELPRRRSGRCQVRMNQMVWCPVDALVVGPGQGGVGLAGAVAREAVGVDVGGAVGGSPCGRRGPGRTPPPPRTTGRRRRCRWQSSARPKATVSSHRVPVGSSVDSPARMTVNVPMRQAVAHW